MARMNTLIRIKWLSLVVLSLSVGMMTTAHANAPNIQLSKSEYHYEIPKCLETLCQSVLKKRIAWYTKENLDLEKLDTDPKTACAYVSIDIAKTGTPWMDKILNDQSTLTQFQQDIDELNADLTDYFSDSERIFGTYMHTDTLNHISTSAITAQFAREFYGYSFGAHGYYHWQIFVLDLQDKKRLGIDDVLIKPAQKDVLFELVKRHFIHHLKTGGGESDDVMTDEDVREHLQFWEFRLSDNFYFTPKGMTFWYSPYEIAPYVMGYVVLNVPKSELNGIIKDKYLNQTFSHFKDEE